MNIAHNAAQLQNDMLRHVRSARPGVSYPAIADLGIIGDRHTAAVITRTGEIVWYCPGRFDAPSLLGGLLDPTVAGSWRVDLPGAVPKSRRYIDESAVLETVLHHPDGRLTVTDWMNLHRSGLPAGLICRTFTAAPADMRLVLTPRPDYGKRVPRLRQAAPDRVVIDERFHLQTSGPVRVRTGEIEFKVAKGTKSWAVLSDGAVATPIASEAEIGRWLGATLAAWRELGKRCSYDGPYKEHVQSSLRALRLLFYEETAGIVAAVTTSLPEVIGGKRNYDYRYTWLRDSGFVVRALLRFEPEGTQAKRHLGFIAGLLGTGYRDVLDPVSAIGGERVPKQAKLGLAGYRASRPGFVGNLAAKQLQLGSISNFLLGAHEIYERVAPGEHWECVAAVADFLAENWASADHGMWEQGTKQQFTDSKVAAACALEKLARFAEPARAERYRASVRDIRAYVDKSCRTEQGGYAAYAGTNTVDMSAAMFPVWGYTNADDPAMDATIGELERTFGCGGDLFHRHLESSKAQRREGAFLVGTFWVAHYWIKRGDLDRGRRIIDSGLTYGNDLGLFSEEIDPHSGMMLGNLPLGLIHASLLAAVADYAEAMGTAPAKIEALTS